MKWSVPDHLIESAKQLIEEKRIIKIGAAKDFPAFFAQVIDERNYHVQLDGTGKEEDICQCTYWQAHQFCVHTVAVELELRRRIGRRYWVESDANSPAFEAIDQSVNLNGLLSIKSQFNQINYENLSNIKDITLNFDSIPISYGGIDDYFISVKLDFLPKEMSAYDFLVKMVENQYLEPMLRFPVETIRQLSQLGQLLLRSSYLRTLRQSKRYRHYLVIDPLVLSEFLTWSKKVNESNDNLSINFQMEWADELSFKPFQAIVDDQVQLKLQRPYQLDLEYKVLIDETNTWHRLTYQQVQTLRILGELAHGTQQYSKRLKVSSGPIFTLGEKYSSMVQALWPVLNEVVEGIPHVDFTNDLMIQIDAEFNENSLNLEVFFEYGDEMSYPIILEEPKVQLVVWRDNKELSFFEHLIEFGAIYQDHQFIFSSKTVNQRWQIAHEILPYLQQFNLNLRVKRQPKIETVRMLPELNEHGRFLTVDFKTDDLDQYEIKQLTEAIQNNRTYVEIEPFQFVSIDSKTEEVVDQLIDQLHLKRSNIEPSVKLPMVKLPLIQRYLERVPEDMISTTSTFDWLMYEFENQSAETVRIDPLIAHHLKPYQVEGVKWLKQLNDWHMGGILADEMGLGKTIQTLALISTQYYDGHFNMNEQVIICCPASLVDNWLDEIERFVPTLRAIAYRGSRARRLQLLNQSYAYQIYVMSYHTFLQDSELFEQIKVATIVLDEAQYVKNDQSKTHQALMKWTHRPIYALSGTPIENKMDELWALIQLIIPGLFDTKQQFESTSLYDIRRMTAPFFLRREKKQVLFDLPDLLEEDILVPLSTFERSLYVSQLDAIKQQMEVLEGRDLGRYRFSILAGLTRLRQICCHPGLVTKEWLTPSSKYKQIVQLLTQHRSDQWLIFSQFASGLPYLASYLKENDYRVFVLDGSTPMNLRQKMVSDFNAGEADVFLISLKAGGTGLNLTGANRVILLDLWWNPAVESQAFARAHRLGQEKDVHVYRLIAEGTIEEEIRELQSAKRNLFNELVADQSEVIELNQSLSDDELRRLFLN